MIDRSLKLIALHVSCSDVNNFFFYVCVCVCVCAGVCVCVGVWVAVVIAVIVTVAVVALLNEYFVAINDIPGRNWIPLIQWIIGLTLPIALDLTCDEYKSLLTTS